MSQTTDPRSRRRGRALPALVAPVFLAPAFLLPGCAARTPPPNTVPAATVVGRWRGTVRSGPARVPSEWTFGPDGRQSVTLTFPQGALTASGTFTVQGGALTMRTAARSFALGDSVRAQPLSDPLETTYVLSLTGDTLTLTPPDSGEALTLTREKPPMKGDSAP